MKNKDSENIQKTSLVNTWYCSREKFYYTFCADGALFYATEPVPFLLSEDQSTLVINNKTTYNRIGSGQGIYGKWMTTYKHKGKIQTEVMIIFEDNTYYITWSDESIRYYGNVNPDNNLIQFSEMRNIYSTEGESLILTCTIFFLIQEKRYHIEGNMLTIENEEETLEFVLVE